MLFHVKSNARVASTFDNTLKPAVKCTSLMWCNDSSPNFDSFGTWQQHVCNAQSYAWHVKQQHGAWRNFQHFIFQIQSWN